MIDYKTEVERLDKFVPGENSQFWKPKAGQYRVKALTELEEAKPFVDKVTKEDIKRAASKYFNLSAYAETVIQSKQ